MKKIETIGIATTFTTAILTTDIIQLILLGLGLTSTIITILTSLIKMIKRIKQNPEEILKELENEKRKLKKGARKMEKELEKWKK